MIDYFMYISVCVFLFVYLNLYVDVTRSFKNSAINIDTLVKMFISASCVVAPHKICYRWKQNHDQFQKVYLHTKLQIRCSVFIVQLVYTQTILLTCKKKKYWINCFYQIQNIFIWQYKSHICVGISIIHTFLLAML